MFFVLFLLFRIPHTCRISKICVNCTLCIIRTLFILFTLFANWIVFTICRIYMNNISTLIRKEQEFYEIYLSYIPHEEDLYCYMCFLYYYYFLYYFCYLYDLCELYYFAIKNVFERGLEFLFCHCDAKFALNKRFNIRTQGNYP